MVNGFQMSYLRIGDKYTYIPAVYLGPGKSRACLKISLKTYRWDLFVQKVEFIQNHGMKRNSVYPSLTITPTRL